MTNRREKDFEQKNGERSTQQNRADGHGSDKDQQRARERPGNQPGERTDERDNRGNNNQP